MNEEVLDIEEDLDDEWEEDDWEDDSVKADFSLFEKKDYIDAVKFFYQHNGGWFYCGKLRQDYVERQFTNGLEMFCTSKNILIKKAS